MNKNVPVRIELAIAIPGALSSFTFAQTAPRSSEVFFVRSSSDAALPTRYDLTLSPPNEVTPLGDNGAYGSTVSSSNEGLLVDEPQGTISASPCVVASVPRRLPELLNQC